MSELPEKQVKRLKSLIQEAETNLAAAKELKEESLNTIRHVLNGKECYAICERGSNNPIGQQRLHAG